MSTKSTQGKRVLIAGGGTGGHVYPGIAIYEALKSRLGDIDALFIGVHGGMEERILSGGGLPHATVTGKGLRGASVMRKLATPVTFARSVWEAMGVVRRFEPDVVIGTGGFASASTVVAAVIKRIPIVLQEQNSVPGLVNRRLARFADLVLLSYDDSRRWIPSRVPSAVVGNPLRAMPMANRSDAATYFGLDAARPTVLVVGGSRGARALNVAMCGAALSLIRDRGVQLIHLTGDKDYEWVRTALGEFADRVKVTPYLDEIHMAYALADVAVARAGASSVFELAIWGVPTVFVPYPYAADDHQAHNVAPLAKNGAAVVVEDGDLTPESLLHAVEGLLDDEDTRANMSAAFRAWSKPDAATAAGGLIAELLKKKSRTTAGRPASGAVTSSRRSTLRVVRR